MTYTKGTWRIASILLVACYLFISADATNTSTTADYDVTTWEDATTVSTTTRRFVFSFPSPSQYWINQYRRSTKITREMDNVLLPLFLVFNICSVLVFLQPKFRKQSICFILCSLAVADSCALIKRWEVMTKSVLNTAVLDTSKFACKLLHYMTYVGRSCSSWYVALFTLERFVAVRYPLKKVTLLNKSRMLILFLIATLISCLSQIYYIAFVSIGRGGHCTIKRETRDMLKLCQFALKDGVGFLLPSILTLLFNVGIITSIRKYATQRAAMSAQEKKADTGNVSLTVMLVSVSLFSIIVTFPTVVAELYYRNIRFYDLLGQTLRVYFDFIAEFNFGCNFIFYCIGGRQFRQEFLKIVTCGLVRRFAGKDQSKTYTTKLGSSSVSASGANVTKTNGKGEAQ